MRKIKTGICVVALMACAVANAEDPPKPDMSYDGTVTFTGKLLAETCEVHPESKSKIVKLPHISTQRLTKSGQVAGSKIFDIKVINCPKSVRQAAAHFEALANEQYNPETGNLKNSKDAKEVEIRLYNPDNSQIRIGDKGHSYSVVPGTDEKDPGSVTMTYMASYYATGATTAGEVEAQVQYVIDYQ